MIKNKMILIKINKYFSKNKISISEIKKYLNKKGFDVSKKNKSYTGYNLSPLSRTFISSLIMISIFFISPMFIRYNENKKLYSKDYENNSKSNFKRTLEGKENKLDSDLDQKFLFDDVLELDLPKSGAVRLSAITIEELFKTTNYDLDDVRKSKLVKPVSLSLLPEEIKNIENTKRRKKFIYSNYFTISNKRK